MKNTIINLILVLLVIALLAFFAMIVRVGAMPDFHAGKKPECSRGCCRINNGK